MDGEDGFLNLGHDLVSDVEGGQGAFAASDDLGGENQGGRDRAGPDVGGAVAQPVFPSEPTVGDLVFGDVGANPGDDEVGAADLPPQVTVDSFGPRVGHGAGVEAGEPLLEVEAVGTDREVPRAVGQPNKG
jgi:hypothetical protein